MEGTISDWLATGVDTVLVAALLSSVVVMLMLTTKLNESVSEQQVVTEEMQEYREHNQFDDTTVYPQDIVSAIYRYRGVPAVYVRSSKGIYQWSENSAPCPWNTAAISALIDQTVMYDASLVYGGNGEVVAYEFNSK